MSNNEWKTIEVVGGRLAVSSLERVITTAAQLRQQGLDLPPLPPLTAQYFEVR